MRGLWQILQHAMSMPTVPTRPSNAEIRAELEQQGDHGTTPRPVTHYAYVENEAGDGGSAEALATDLLELGFQIRRCTATTLIFDAVHAVGLPDFDLITARLEACCAAHGWDYDGWECEAILPPGRRATQQRRI